MFLYPRHAGQAKGLPLSMEDRRYLCLIDRYRRWLYSTPKVGRAFQQVQGRFLPESAWRKASDIPREPGCSNEALYEHPPRGPERLCFQTSTQAPDMIPGRIESLGCCRSWVPLLAIIHQHTYIHKIAQEKGHIDGGPLFCMIHSATVSFRLPLFPFPAELRHKPTQIAACAITVTHGVWEDYRIHAPAVRLRLNDFFDIPGGADFPHQACS